MLEEARTLIDEREADFPGNLEKARELLETDNSGEARTLLSEALFWLGEYAQSDSDKEPLFKAGVEAGKEAVALLPEDVAANLWYAANMGSHGVVRGIMSSLFYLGPIEKHGKKAMELDPDFFHAAPLRLMGRFYHQCPGWPIGKGDMNKAIKTLEQAVKKAPGFLQNQFYLADVLAARRKKDRAKALLDEILAISEPELFPDYQKQVLAEAKSLRAKL